MTRKSKREIERELDNMDSTARVETPVRFVTETEGGETVDLEGDAVTQAELDRSGIIFNFSSPGEDHRPEPAE